jgi:hypothetical protein
VATIRVATAYEPHRRVHEMPGGPATVTTIPDPDKLAAALDAVRRLDAEVDVRVVYFHWGVMPQRGAVRVPAAGGRAARARGGATECSSRLRGRP